MKSLILTCSTFILSITSASAYILYFLSILTLGQ